MSDDQILWQTKLAARLHDPAEKAMVLLRDPVGHEKGTRLALIRLLGFNEITGENVDRDNDEAIARTLFKKGIPKAMERHIQRADWWASAADRPKFPLDEIPVTTKKGEQKTLAVSGWAQVRWANDPQLIHPLTGETIDLHRFGGLTDTTIDAVKQRSFDHFSRLLMRNEGKTDFRKSLLAFWRFGPDLGVTHADTADNDQLGQLWELLPADTRIPDHSIWDHLDLVSAFAGAFSGDPDGEVALLSLSIGPVQPFIAAARKTDDLWAGSHLLARLSWEALRPVCERLGPDAILFPRLRGIPQVDLWLREQMGLPQDLFKDCDWNKGGTDANPLFSAALPNRFVAVVPASQAKAIAGEVENHVRHWLQDLGERVVTELLTAAGYGREQETTATPQEQMREPPAREAECDLRRRIPTPYEQMKQQLAGFPEVHWAAVPFSLIRCRDPQKQRDLDITQLSASMRPFFSGTGAPGFLGTPAWQVLQKELQLVDDDGHKSVFFAPNPGVLYPAVFELAERVLAAAKSCRPFAQTRQQGWRCSLTGEAEWLTTDRAQLDWNQGYRQQQHTLWTKINKAKPSWAKEGEHLSALPAIKRLWPTLFKREVDKALADAGSRPSPATASDDQGATRPNGENAPSGESINRFVVSTYTMALAHQLEGIKISDALKEKLKNQPRVALPRKLAKALYKAGKDANLIARIPGWLEAAAGADEDGKALEQAQRRIEFEPLLGGKLETYYSLLMLDGDHMGAILSGDETTGTTITYEDSFHPKVREGFANRAAEQAELKRYGEQKRAVSPNRHLAISAALNDFSQTVVRHVVEEEHLGRLIYAGGDDVLAMLPVADLLDTMQRLRHAYSGTLPEDEKVDWSTLRGRKTLVCKNGFAWLDGRLMRMMGRHATASCGAVIAHHQAPLAAVMRELRAAEQRAKHEGGRDAFSITVIKRAGGALHLTAKWGEPVALLLALRDFLSSDGVSRRAVYHTLQWLDAHELPVTAFDPEPGAQPAPATDQHAANQKESPESAGNTCLIHSLLAYQLDRQSQGEAKQKVRDLARRLVELARSWRPEQPGKPVQPGSEAAQPCAEPARQPTAQPTAPAEPPAPTAQQRTELLQQRIDKLRNFLSVAEFLARETRTGSAA